MTRSRSVFTSSLIKRCMNIREEKWWDDGEKARTLENQAGTGNTRLLGVAWPRTSLHNRWRMDRIIWTIYQITKPLLKLNQFLQTSKWKIMGDGSEVNENHNHFLFLLWVIWALQLLFSSTSLLSKDLSDSHLILKVVLVHMSQKESRSIIDLPLEGPLEIFLIPVVSLRIREGSGLSKITWLGTSRDWAFTPQ